MTQYKWMNGVEYIFATLDRHVSGEECDQLAEKYFPNHNQMTLPGEMLFVDLRPVFRKPLTDVTPKFHAAVRKSDEQALIRQGVEIGRPSEIFVRATRKGDHVINIRVGGRAVEVLRGAVTL